MKVFPFFVLLCFFSNDIYCNCDLLLVCIPSGPDQGGVNDASDLSSLVFTESCTSEQAHHDQAGKIQLYL